MDQNVENNQILQNGSSLWPIKEEETSEEKERLIYDI